MRRTDTITVTARAAGEGILTLTLAAPGCDWQAPGRESAVATVAIGGVRRAELVCFAGASPHPYPILTGPLTAGKHTVTITFRPELSPKGAQGIVVHRSQLRTTNDPVIAHAPLFYGRPENATSDTPLLVAWSRTETPTHQELTYTIHWSNEDGGTGRVMGTQIARWGRTTDIEWVYTVRMDKRTGEAAPGIYQAANHQTRTFAGQFVGRHPLLRTATLNNNMADTGESPLLFAVAPTWEHRESKTTREAAMDVNPWMYAIAAAEMRREGKVESPTNPATSLLAELRDYLNVEVDASVPAGAAYAARVTLRDGRIFFSDHDARFNAIDRSGWVRTTVKLPAGTTEREIADVTIVRRGNGTEPVVVRGLKAFLLDGRERPRRPVVQRYNRTWLASP